MFEQFGIALILCDDVFAGFGRAFSRFLQPATIFIALPLSNGGAAGGLPLYGGVLDLSAVIGILMLMATGKTLSWLVDFVIEKMFARKRRQAGWLSSGARRDPS